MAFLTSALCLLAVSGGPVAGAPVVKGTLVVGVLKIESSYARNYEKPAHLEPRRWCLQDEE